jgi:hypothetical protein
VLQRWEVTRLSLTRLVTAQRILAGDALRCSFSCFLSSCDIGGDPEANTPPLTLPAWMPRERHFQDSLMRGDYGQVTKPPFRDRTHPAVPLPYPGGATTDPHSARPADGLLDR